MKIAASSAVEMAEIAPSVRPLRRFVAGESVGKHSSDGNLW